jgi:hypothetical protein
MNTVFYCIIRYLWIAYAVMEITVFAGVQNEVAKKRVGKLPDGKTV